MLIHSSAYHSSLAFVMSDVHLQFLAFVNKNKHIFQSHTQNTKQCATTSETN